jgi:hypothetical protein
VLSHLNILQEVPLNLMKLAIVVEANSSFLPQKSKKVLRQRTLV